VPAVHRSVSPPGCHVIVAVDTTGLTLEAITTVFVQRVQDRSEGLTWCPSLKWTMFIDVDRLLEDRAPTLGTMLAPVFESGDRRFDTPAGNPVAGKSGSRRLGPPPVPFTGSPSPWQGGRGRPTSVCLGTRHT
jgi:hypothetical protein